MMEAFFGLTMLMLGLGFFIIALCFLASEWPNVKAIYSDLRSRKAPAEEDEHVEATKPSHN